MHLWSHLFISSDRFCVCVVFKFWHPDEYKIFHCHFNLHLSEYHICSHTMVDTSDIRKEQFSRQQIHSSGHPAPGSKCVDEVTPFSSLLSFCFATSSSLFFPALFLLYTFSLPFLLFLSRYKEFVIQLCSYKNIVTKIFIVESFGKKGTTHEKHHSNKKCQPFARLSNYCPS